MTVLSGLDQIETRWPRFLRDARVGLVVHPASVNRSLHHASVVAARSRKFTVRSFLGPQHGIYGETQDNMVEWEGFRDRRTGLPVYSLYGRTRKPRPEMLSDLDALVVDLQDVGARYYTFIWTMELCMQACEESGRPLIVLDRPNPVGGILQEGPILDMRYASFVGLRPLPVRHGMTMGEIGTYLAREFHPSLDFFVITMRGWRRDMWFHDTGLPWVLPSPNMPTVETATVYPGMCLIEGTTLSEGRGTTRPFEIFGAPWVEPEGLVRRLEEFRLPGVRFRPLYFRPTFQKHADRLCGGAQIHVSDRLRFRPFKTAVAILKAVRELNHREKLWRDPPYEYETEKLPFDILSGSDRLRKDIDRSESLKNMEGWWSEETRRFAKTLRASSLLYA
ncbi:MAG TPA: DUF1343 domain-containing protein [Dissulfurispiraceae bacterium]|nr:DUF1343 domain-containing protein [Dissulfurispiraceae bacterium]